MTKYNSTTENMIRLLGQDARQNCELLAQQLNVSAATVRRRMRKLLREDTLRIIGVVDPIKLGFPLTALFTIDVSHDKMDQFIEELGKNYEVKWMSLTTGTFDIIAIAYFRSNDHLSEFLTKRLHKIDGFKDCETFVCLSVKKGVHVPFTSPF